MFRALDVSTSALVAQRARLDVIAGNVANARSTRDASGEVSPFRRRFVTFEAEGTNAANPDRPGAVGVRFEVKIDETSEPRRLHQPGHPDADADGYVSLPNIDLTTEFVNAVEAGRAYEANVAAVEMTKELARQSLEILA